MLELQEFKEGVQLNAVAPNTLRLALIGIFADLPAIRKTAGFVSFCGQRGCSRCLKKFIKLNDKTDYSGYDRSNWEKRDISSHKITCKKYLMCNKTRKV